MRAAMKMVAVLGAAVVLAGVGCKSVMPAGGTIGAVQTADDAMAGRVGVNADMMAKARAALGIIDTRTLPAADRVLPSGYTWTQDILDASNRVVDVSEYHYSAPRVVQSGTVASVPVVILPGAGTNAVSDAQLEGLLQSLLPLLGTLGTNSPLLAPAK